MVKILRLLVNYQTFGNILYITDKNEFTMINDINRKEEKNEN